ncbi:uncharacterized protein LOC128988009 [Macrosteles quadrilineatus]|uniref:uncharacterized protein LOC128988009 n=1 Tax=Macrosteles quadrilineatus TaxID=74068 RepID=UPI0023E2DFCB|nr:uncharacterized protein LOC128988009 [Macrosteles quadrilineatus]
MPVLSIYRVTLSFPPKGNISHTGLLVSTENPPFETAYLTTEECFQLMSMIMVVVLMLYIIVFYKFFWKLYKALRATVYSCLATCFRKCGFNVPRADPYNNLVEEGLVIHVVHPKEQKVQTYHCEGGRGVL